MTGFWQRKVENLSSNLGISIKLFQSSSRQTGSDDDEKPCLLVEKSRDPNNNLDLSIKLFQNSSRQTGSDDDEKPCLLVEKSRDPNNNLDLSIISEFLEADWF